MTSTNLSAEINALDKLALEAQARNDLDGAMQYYQKILDLAPGAALSYMNMATIALLQGNYDGAITCDEIALKLQPNTPQIHLHLGIAYQKAGRVSDAFMHFERALALTPDDPLTLCNFASLYNDDPLTAKELFKRILQPLLQAISMQDSNGSIEFDEIHANALVGYISICLESGEWEEASSLYPLLASITHAQLANNFQPAITPYLATIIFKDQELVLAIALSYANTRHIDISKKFTSYAKPDTHINIGYLYNGFDNYIYNQALAELINKHDQQKFQISIMHTKPLPEKFKKAISNSNVQFIDLEHLSFYFAAQKIHQHNIHVILDTLGLIPDAKPEILNFNPAIAQINFLGNYGSMGSSDGWQFVISDQYLTPETDHKFYVEDIVQLPSFMSFPSISVDKSLKREDFGLPNDKIVFANFSPALMIDNVAFESWMRILLQVPNSVLWLNYTSDLQKNTLLNKAEQYGLDATRLFFAKAQPLSEKFIHQLADIYLETAVANSEYNVLASLYSDKPVAVIQGSNPISRVAGVFLMNADLAENICTNVDEYVQCAVNLALDNKRYQEMVNKIKKSRTNSILFNQDTYIKKFEQAIQDVLVNRIKN